MENSFNERFESIEYNLSIIRNNIAEAAQKSGRTADDVLLMAVTKTVEPVFINHAIKNGINLIGENKVQEFLSKKEYLELQNVDCHLIGHLQSNKAKQIVGQVSTIQSVDSLKLFKEISKHSVRIGVTTKCLVEVNIGTEDSKSGILYDEVMPLIEEASKLENIAVEGLMAIPPICNSDEVKKYFEQMNRLFVDIAAQNIDNIKMNTLSMGMSSDYVEAVECGANLVRVGSLIFGPRIY